MLWRFHNYSKLEYHNGQVANVNCFCCWLCIHKYVHQTHWGIAIVSRGTYCKPSKNSHFSYMWLALIGQTLLHVYFIGTKILQPLLVPRSPIYVWYMITQAIVPPCYCLIIGGKCRTSTNDGWHDGNGWCSSRLSWTIDPCEQKNNAIVLTD